MSMFETTIKNELVYVDTEVNSVSNRLSIFGTSHISCTGCGAETLRPATTTLSMSALAGSTPSVLAERVLG